MSVALHGKDAEEKQVIIDTTVQEKNVTYPTDGKLAIEMIHHLHHIAKTEGIQLRRTYLKEIKGHRISLRFFRHCTVPVFFITCWFFYRFCTDRTNAYRIVFGYYGIRSQTLFTST